MRKSSWLCCVVLAAAYGQDTPPTPPPQQPPAAPGTPQTVKPKVEIPPEPPKSQAKAAPAERDTGGDAFSIEPFYWRLNSSGPRMRKADDSTFTQAGALD